jgi:uncharacterized protein (TIGR02996 family)
MTSPADMRRALEDALVADPDDRAAHMAYADWLMEQGDPRGEFIQVQLALEDEGRSAAERKGLREREAALLKAHARQWLGSLADYLIDARDATPPRAAAVDPRLAAWERLFGAPLDQPGPEEVAADPGILDRRGYVFQFTRGWLASLSIRRLTEEFAGVLALAPAARLLQRLTVRDGEDYDPPLAPLAGSDWVGRLRAFQLGQEDGPCHVGAEGAVTVIARMTRLEELRLFAHRVDTERLFALQTLGHLRVLQIDHLRDYPLERLAENSALGKLTHLLIHPHAIEPGDEEPHLRLAHLSGVVNSPHLNSLTHLRFRLSDAGDEGCREVVRSGILTRLKVLDLRGGTVTDEGARVLAACPDLHRLELLDLSRNALTGEGLDALRAAGIQVVAEGQWRRGPQGGVEDLGEMEFLYEGDWE